MVTDAYFPIIGFEEILELTSGGYCVIYSSKDIDICGTSRVDQRSLLYRRTYRKESDSYRKLIESVIEEVC